jgi:hypothetical protein
MLLKSVVGTTVQEDVEVPQTLADTITSVSSADNHDMAKGAAISKLDVIYGMGPKYLV